MVRCTNCNTNILTYNKNLIEVSSSIYGAEMDIEGSQIFTQQAWDDHLQKVDIIILFPWEFNISANNEVEYESFEKYSNSFSIRKVSDLEYFLTGEKESWGNFTYFDDEYLIDLLYDDDDLLNLFDHYDTKLISDSVKAWFYDVIKKGKNNERY